MGNAKSALPSRWLVFVAVVVGSICMGISWYKVTGTMSFVRGEYGIDVATAGMMMSAVALANLLIALPGGSIVSKFGVRKVWLFALLWCLACNVAGFFAPDFNILIVTRLGEGVSIGLVFIVAPVIIADAFPAERRGLPMMLWSIWPPAATLVALNLCNVFTPLFGWQSNWLASAAFLAAAFLMNFILCKVAPGEPAQDAAGEKAAGKGGWAECLKNPACVGICLVFFASVFAFDSYVSYYPTFLQDTLGIGAAEANSVATAHTYWTAFLCLTFGFVLNRVPNKHHPKIYLVAIVFAAVGGMLMWDMPTIPLDIVAILLCGTGMQIVGPMAHSLMPDAVSSKAVPIGMGMIAFASGLGSMIGPVVSGTVVDATGSWGLLAVPVGAASLVGIVAAVVVVRKMARAHAAIAPAEQAPNDRLEQA